MDFVFNGSKGSTKGIELVSNVVRDIAPAVTIGQMKVPGQHGFWPTGITYEARVITIDIVLAKNTITELRDSIRTLSGWLITKEPKELFFDDDPDRYYLAMLSGQTPFEQLVAEGKGTLTFICPDPFIYAKTPKTVSTFPAQNEGGEPCLPIITCTATKAIEELKVTLTTTGEFLLLERPIAENDVVVFNCEKELVTVNGVDVRPDLTVESDYFQLPVGQFSVAVEPSGVTISMTYRERWV